MRPTKVNVVMASARLSPTSALDVVRERPDCEAYKDNRRMSFGL